MVPYLAISNGAHERDREDLPPDRLRRRVDAGVHLRDHPELRGRDRDPHDPDHGAAHAAHGEVDDAR